MDIALLTPFFPQRSETFVIGLAIDLLERGHRVRIFCLSGARTGLDHPGVAEHDLLGRTIPLMSGDRRQRTKVALALARAVRHLPASFRYLLPLGRPDLGRGMKIPSAAAAMALLAGEESLPLRFDVIHAQFGPMAIVADALREMDVIQGPLLATFHGSDVSAWGRNDPSRYHGLFSRVDGVTANSEFLRGRLLERGAPPNRTVRLPMGVDLTRFRPGQKDEEPVRFLTVARLSEEKDPLTAVRAMSELKSRGHDFHYTMIGEGALRNEVERLIQELGLDEQVQLQGAATHTEVAAAMRGHHVFILPGAVAASGAVEAQGLVLVEAQAAGLPVVAASVGGIPETIGRGAGRLVAPADALALADELETLLRHREEWPGMGEAGRRHAERSYDRVNLLQRTLEVYESLSAAERRGEGAGPAARRTNP